MSFDRQKVIDIALAEEGYLEKASNSQLDSKTENAGKANWTKYARDLDNIKFDDGKGFYNSRKNGNPWCDIFIDWCFVQAYGVEDAMKLLCQPKGSSGAGCTYSARYYKSKGQFFTKNPQPGDQIFFGSESDGSNHTGIVYAVDDKKVYTVEGNTSGTKGVVSNGGGVWKKSYSLSYAKIYGFGRPLYGDSTSSVEIIEPEEVKPNSEERIDTISEVQDWLNSKYSAGIEADGVYGDETRIALTKALQKCLGVGSDGEYGRITYSAMRRAYLKKGMTGKMVEVLQAFLVCNGYPEAYVDGHFGSGTESSLIDYQSNDKHNLEVDGIAGQETMRSLCNSII